MWSKSLTIIAHKMLLFLYTLRLGNATECFPKSESKLPKIHMHPNESNYDGTNERFYAITGCDEFVIYGGNLDAASSADAMTTLGDVNTPVLSRLDLDLLTRRWSKVFNIRGMEPNIIWGLALSPYKSKVAVHAYEDKYSKDVDKGDAKS